MREGEDERKKNGQAEPSETRPDGDVPDSALAVILAAGD